MYVKIAWPGYAVCVHVMFVDVRVMCIYKYCVASVMCLYVYLPALLTGNGKISNMKFPTTTLESSNLT